MMDSFSISDFFPVDRERLYLAWLDAKTHGEMTGTSGTGDSRVGGKFALGDGYITGENLELDPPRRIVQAWRSTDFPSGSAFSRLELRFEPVEGGTLLTLVHSEIPDGHGPDYEEGWKTYYFKPMKNYFA